MNVFWKCKCNSWEGIWENTVHTVLSENFETLQTLSHMYDVVPKWLKKCTVRALKCYLHLNLNHSVPNWTIFLANSKQNLHPFSTLLYFCNNHKSKPFSVPVASKIVVLKGGIFTEMTSLFAARKPNGFDFSVIQIISLFLSFAFVLLHQSASKKPKTKHK